MSRGCLSSSSISLENNNLKVKHYHYDNSCHHCHHNIARNCYFFPVVRLFKTIFYLIFSAKRQRIISICWRINNTSWLTSNIPTMFCILTCWLCCYYCKTINYCTKSVWFTKYERQRKHEEMIELCILQSPTS